MKIRTIKSPGSVGCPLLVLLIALVGVVVVDEAHSEPLACVTARECHAHGERLAKGGTSGGARRAAPYFERACDASWAPGCEALASLYLDGRLTQPDEGALFSAHRRACEASSARRCLELALLYREGRSVHRSTARASSLADSARRHLEALCRLEWGSSCLELGLLLHRGDLVAPEPVRARLLLKRSCHTLRQGRGCYNLAVVAEGSAPEGLMTLACRQGYARACPPGVQRAAAGAAPEQLTCDLDQPGAPPRCDHPDQPQVSWQEALPLHDRVMWRMCREGEATACLKLSDIHAFGIEAPIDASIASALRRRAVELLERRCAQRDPGGCKALADLFTQGRYVAPDPKRVEGARQVTRNVHSESCRGGDTDACHALARATLRDPGGDLKVAMGLLAQTCEDDHPQACARLAGIFNQTRRPEFDRGKALRLYRKACYLGAMPSCRTAMRLWLKAGVVDEAVDAQRFMARRHQARCDEGDGGACLSLYAVLSEGPRPDLEAAHEALRVAVKLLERRCREGNASSCARLARLVRQPELPVSDALRSRQGELLERACVLGSPLSQSTARACVAAGLMFELDPPPHVQRAARVQELYKRACVGGSAQACVWIEDAPEAWRARAAGLYRRSCARRGEGCVELELLYLRGEAPRPPEADAMQWAIRLPELKRACRRRKESACVQLGLVYRDGMGVAADAKASRRYFRRVERIRRRKCRSRGACEGLLELCRVGVEDACPAAKPISGR